MTRRACFAARIKNRFRPIDKKRAVQEIDVQANKISRSILVSVTVEFLLRLFPRVYHLFYNVTNFSIGNKQSTLQIADFKPNKTNIGKISISAELIFAFVSNGRILVLSIISAPQRVEIVSMRWNEYDEEQSPRYHLKLLYRALPHEFHSRRTLAGRVKKITDRMSAPPACFGNCYVRSRPEVREILREDKRSFNARHNPRVKY